MLALVNKLNLRRVLHPNNKGCQKCNTISSPAGIYPSTPLLLHWLAVKCICINRHTSFLIPVRVATDCFQSFEKKVHRIDVFTLSFYAFPLREIFHSSPKFYGANKVCLRNDLNLSILLISVDEDLNALLTPNIRSVYIIMFFQFPLHSILSFVSRV